MSQKVGANNNKVYRLVLTGGPSGGKTMGQARLCTFFESIGWKVYRVPETLSIFTGGIVWAELNSEDKVLFYENALKTMMNIENAFFNMASTCADNCLVVCDRGSMDIVANLTEAEWRTVMARTGWNNVAVRDSRYNQVVHMVSAAKGAESFCSLHKSGGAAAAALPSGALERAEVIATAARLDEKYSQAWVGHPYFDVIDNSTDFERKLVRMIASVCNHLSIEPGDRLSLDSKKRKFLIRRLPDELVCSKFQDFIVAHDYLATPNHKMQARIRRRGQNGNWTYTHTIRRPDISRDQSPELKIEITLREYELLLAQKHAEHCTVFKKRRCFLWNNQYFQMDIYQEPCQPRCKGLVMLETYTSVRGDDFQLPDFLDVIREVTDDPSYSMYNLSRVEAPPAKPEQRKAIRGAANSNLVASGFSKEAILGGTKKSPAELVLQKKSKISEGHEGKVSEEQNGLVDIFEEKGGVSEQGGISYSDSATKAENPTSLMKKTKVELDNATKAENPTSPMKKSKVELKNATKAENPTSPMKKSKVELEMNTASPDRISRVLLAENKAKANNKNVDKNEATATFKHCSPVNGIKKHSLACVKPSGAN